VSIKEQRLKARHARRDMTDEDRTEASHVICKRVIKTREFFSSKTIGCYLPMREEVDTRAIIERAWRANKRIFVPVLRGGGQMAFCRIDPDTELEQDSFGIWEPKRGVLIAPWKLDLVITPTVAFDNNNNRIGMGSGYYDRCFSFLRNRRHWIRPKLLGVAFQCQEVEKITPNTWDIRLYRIITESK